LVGKKMVFGMRMLFVRGQAQPAVYCRTCGRKREVKKKSRLRFLKKTYAAGVKFREISLLRNVTR
jgi:hypothetical protein